MSSVRTRIMLLLTFVAVSVAIAAFSWENLEARRAQALWQSTAHEKQVLLDKLVDLKGARLASLVPDYAFWGELARFVHTRDRTWATKNLVNLPSNYNCSAIWVYNPDLLLVYSAGRDRARKITSLPLPRGAVRRMFAGRQLCHFFVPTKWGLMEVHGARIHASADKKQAGPSFGFFFVGKIWDQDYVDGMVGLMGGQAKLLPASVGYAGDGERHRWPGAVHFHRILPGWDGRPVEQLRVTINWPYLTLQKSSMARANAVLVLYSLLVLGLISAALMRWVTQPLQDISKALVNGDPEPVVKLSQARNEFGGLAHLIRAFFAQKEALVTEVAERKRAEAEIKALNESLEQRVTERTAQLEASNKQLRAGIVRREKAEKGLRQSEDRFRSLVEHASDGIFICDSGGIISEANTACCAMLGYTREEILTRSLTAFVGPEDISRVTRELQRVLSGESVVSEWNILNKDGTPVAVEVSGRKLPDGRLLGIVRNITERKKAQEALVDAEAKFRGLVEQSLAGIYINQDGKFAYVNPRFAEIFGYTLDEITSLESVLEVVDEQDRGLVQENIRLRLEGVVSSTHYTFQGKTKSGDLVDCEAHGTCTVYQGRPAILGTLLDVSERVKAGETIRVSEERYRSLVEQASDAILIADSGGLIADANTSTCMLLGYWREELVGQPFVSLFAPVDAPSMAAMLSDLVRGEMRVTESQFRSKKGDLVPIEISAKMLPDGRILGIARNITDRMQSEEALRAEVAERTQAEEKIRALNRELERRLSRIEALRQIDMAIASSLDLHLTLGVCLEQVIGQLHVDAAAVMLFDPHTQSLQYAAAKGFSIQPLRNRTLRLGRGHAGQAAMEGRMVSVPDVTLDPSVSEFSDVYRDERFISYHAVPLMAKGQVKGVLEVFHRTPLGPGAEWLDYLEILAGQAAIAIDSSLMFSEVQHSNLELTLAYDDTIEGWSRALDLRDRCTQGHTERVMEQTLQLARIMSVPKEKLVHIRRGVLLHDIGKMGTPDSILLKPGRLTDEEWSIMKRHPTNAYEMISPIEYLLPAIDIPYCHHEKWDGTGYPRGLKGEQIPLAARIFAVIDVWDALTSDRPYRKGWSAEKVREHIRSLSGSHFDPDVVDAFLKMTAPEGEQENEPPAAKAA